MKARFTYAVRYAVTARCLTPLRTADADGSTEQVLRGADGSCLIQGSSLAGALRSWAQTHETDVLVNALFGNQSSRGSLVVSDGRFDNRTEIVVRPRLRIDSRTGAAHKNGKFDLAHVGAGAEFRFTLHWLGDKETLDDTKAVERMLAALHQGEILLGAQKNNGFGRVSLCVMKQTYDLRRAGDRECWLSDAEGGEPLTLPNTERKQVTLFCLKGVADSLLVKAASTEHESGGSYTYNLTEAGYPLIPGSSVKGAVRARAELIAGVLGLPEEFTEDLFGRGVKDEDNGLAGKLRFEDTVLSKSAALKISRIRINRFTGGVVRGGLFSEEPISGEISLRASIPSEDKAGCMLLLYALRDLALGLYNLGSGGSIGRGFLRVDELNVLTPEGQTLTLRFNDEKNCIVSDPAGLLPVWRQALEVKR